METVSSLEAQAAIAEPSPGKNRLKTTTTTATGLLTYGTFVVNSHIYLSTSSTGSILFVQCSDAIFLIAAVSIL